MQNKVFIYLFDFEEKTVLIARNTQDHRNTFNAWGIHTLGKPETSDIIKVMIVNHLLSSIRHCTNLKK